MTATLDAPAAARLGDGPGALPRRSVVVALATALLGVLAAGALAWPRPPAEDSAEVGFARDMSVHHAQAVRMAEAVRDRTQDRDLRFLAQDIALTQQAQIGAMGAWLDDWGYSRRVSGEAMAWMGMPTSPRSMPGMASPDELVALSELPVAQAEDRFLTLMVAHHTGGVSMAQAGVELAEDRQVVELAEGIAAAQAFEIDALQDLRAVRGLPPAPVPELESHDLSSDHHAGATGSATDLPLWLLVVLGATAAGWLALDARSRSTGQAPRRIRPEAGVAAAGALAAALVHAALTPPHASESLSYGVFFTGSMLLLVLAAALLLAGRERAGAVLGGATSLLLVIVWALFRVVAPPGAGSPEGVDAWGVSAVAAELLLVVASAAVLRKRSAHEHSGPGRIPGPDQSVQRA